MCQLIKVVHFQGCSRALIGWQVYFGCVIIEYLIEWRMMNLYNEGVKLNVRVYSH